MSDPLVTQRQLEGLLRRLRKLEERVGRTEVRESLRHETGTFVPAWAGSTIAGTFTYTAASTLVEWERFNNRVIYNGRIVISAIGVAPTGNLTITGWPYPGVTDAGMLIAGGGTLITWALNVAAGYTDVSLQFTNSSVATLLKNGDNIAPAAVAGGELIVGDCRFAGQYRIA